MRLKSSMTGNPLAYFNSSGTTVHPRRTPVNPANLEKDEISIATCVTKTPNSFDVHQNTEARVSILINVNEKPLWLQEFQRLIWGFHLICRQHRQSHKLLWSRLSWQNQPAALTASKTQRYQLDCSESRRILHLSLEWQTGQGKNCSQLHSSCKQCCCTSRFSPPACRIDQQLHWYRYKPVSEYIACQ